MQRVFGYGKVLSTKQENTIFFNMMDDLRVRNRTITTIFWHQAISSTREKACYKRLTSKTYQNTVINFSYDLLINLRKYRFFTFNNE